MVYLICIRVTKGGDRMSHITKERLQDCSTKDAFSFSLRCAECGEVWKSKEVSFSRAGIVPETLGKRVVFEAL